MKRTLSLVAGTVLLLTGCGYKNDPVPPQSVVPMAIEDLHYQIEGSSVKLSWKYPIETIKGTAIIDIAGFQLYRAGVPLDKYCKTCPIPFGNPQNLPGGSSYDGEQRRVASFTSSGMKPGYKYFFKVTSRTGWLAASPDSNIISFAYSLPPATPTGLKGQANNGAVKLTWEGVTKMKNGKPLSGVIEYQILRNGVKIAGPFTQTNYIDKQVQNGNQYSYSVQAVLLYSGEPVAGTPCEAISLQPKDNTAPDAPTGTHAVATAEGIKIFWDNSTDRDIAGYNIYRKADGDKNYSKIGSVKAIYTIYTDSKVKKDVRYQYVVTATDKTGNESAHSRTTAPRD